jgi:hypothetical protein
VFKEYLGFADLLEQGGGACVSAACAAIGGRLAPDLSGNGGIEGGAPTPENIR